MEASSAAVSPELPSVLRGSCRCGNCIYTSRTLPIAITFCHCVPCRKASGAAFLSFGLFHNTALQFHGLEADVPPPIKQGLSPITVCGIPIAIRSSCGVCGSPLFMRYHCRPDATSVNLGVIDDASVESTMPKPKEHIFLREKACWFSLPDDGGLDRCDGFNEPFQLRLQDWITRGCPQRVDMPACGPAQIGLGWSEPHAERRLQTRVGWKDWNE